ncbi:hypothetical protein [Devosia sp.]|uniref:hypothetical protein n=1 Tax=Devosia sp. TaxID=1871048 RepID=UPI002AFE24BD|nr:hypothetical protein [Devosia sp.]
MQRARTEAFEHTISGLLTKRSELFGEAEKLRQKLAEIHNDIGAVDRALSICGYEGDLAADTPPVKRTIVFARNELTRSIIAILKQATEPMSAMEIAHEIVGLRGEDANDKKYLADLKKRVGAALRSMRSDGFLQSEAEKQGILLWKIRKVK